MYSLFSITDFYTGAEQDTKQSSNVTNVNNIETKATNALIIPLCSISKRNESVNKAKGTGLFLSNMEANELATLDSI